jgi:hypothetical protein
VVQGLLMPVDVSTTSCCTEAARRDTWAGHALCKRAPLVNIWLTKELSHHASHPDPAVRLIQRPNSIVPLSIYLGFSERARTMCSTVSLPSFIRIACSWARAITASIACL